MSRTLRTAAWIALAALAAWLAWELSASAKSRAISSARAAPTGELDSKGAAVVPALDASGRLDAPAKAVESGGGAQLVARAIAKEDGRPVEHVRFEIFENRASASIDSLDGTARFPATPAQRYRLRATALDEPRGTAESELAPLAVGESREVAIAIATRPDVHFVARVVEADTRAAIPDAWAEVLTQTYDHDNECNGSRSNSIAVLRSDADGFVEVDEPSWIGRALELQLAGRNAALAVVGREHADRTHALTVALERSAMLVVRAKLAPGFTAGPVTLRASAPSSALASFDLDSVRSTSDFVERWCLEQSFAVGTPIEWRCAVPSGVNCDLALETNGQRLASANLLLAPGEERVCEFDLRVAYAIRGVYYDVNGRAAPRRAVRLVSEQDRIASGAFEWAEGRASTTDDAGRFVFTAVTPGTWIVGVDSSRAPSNPRAITPPITTTILNHDEEVELKEFTAGALEIRVLDPSGATASNVWVSARPCDRESGAIVVDARDGSAKLAPLADVDYVLLASSRVFADSEPVFARPGEPTVTLRLREPSRIRVHCIDADGLAVDGALVTASQRGPDDSSFDASARSHDGFAELERIAEGTIALQAVDREQRRACLTARVAREATFELVLAPAARLEFSYSGQKLGTQVVVRNNGVRIAAFELSRERPTPVELAAGSVVIESRSFDRDGVEAPNERTLEVSAGARIAVALDDASTHQ